MYCSFFIFVMFVTFLLQHSESLKAFHATTKEETDFRNSFETTSLNKKCIFRYTYEEQKPTSPEEEDTFSAGVELKMLSCSYCPERECSFERVLSEVECLKTCCPFSNVYLTSQSTKRMDDCAELTLMGHRQIQWVENDFVYPFLIIVIALLICILVILLIKTVLFLLYENCWKDKNNRPMRRGDNSDDVTQEEAPRERWIGGFAVEDYE